ncbi:hypothetical protein, partial [Xenorhabdus eapokensis]|uniref:hypothetical protein n=1 Tax=Xenorhabdus eapokensis TaxID=1873482 RepID=UPI001ABEFB47
IYHRWDTQCSHSTVWFWDVHFTYRSGEIFSGHFQISPHDEHPCRSANTSPCRVCRGLSPPSRRLTTTVN